MNEPLAEFQLPAIDLAKLAQVAKAVARTLRSADGLVLTGGLAAGKTQFVKLLAEALQIKDTVTSPTFTLAHFYSGPELSVLHVDAYRLETPAEFADLALDDFLENHVIAVEWGANFIDLLPPSLEIELQEESPTTRRLRFSTRAPEWRDRLNALRAALEAFQPCH